MTSMPIEILLDISSTNTEPSELYSHLIFPAPPPDRPYIYINMAATVDGKIVVGKKGGTAAGVGSATDQLLFRRLQKCAHGALIGSGTLRAGTVIYPPELARFVVTNSGELPLTNRFFTDAPEKAYVIAPSSLNADSQKKIQEVCNLILQHSDPVDLKDALAYLRCELGISTLLCEGGSELNSHIVQNGLADELFLTLSPKIKGGSQLPTIVGGKGFSPDVTSPLKLQSIYHDGDELYLRYLFG